MSTSHRRLPAERTQQLAALLAATSMALVGLCATATAHADQPAATIAGSGEPVATISSATLHRAIASRASARRAFERNTHKLSACMRAHRRSCRTDRRAVKTSKTRLRSAERLVRSLTATIARARLRNHSKPVEAASAAVSTRLATSSGSTTSSTATTAINPNEITSSTAPAASSVERTTSEGSQSSSTEASKTPPPASSEPFVKGVSIDLEGWGEPAITEIASEIHTAGAGWVRADLSWSEVMPSPGVYDWSHFDKLIRDAQANGLHVLPILGYAPEWTTPRDSASYASFVAAAVARYGPGTNANLQWFELWNEPYFAYAWSSQTPEPAAYARDARAAAQAAKQESPTVKLLVSADYTDAPQNGSTPWQTSWIDDMFTAVPDLGSWIDGVAVHPYGDDPALPLAQTGGWKDANGEWAFQRIDTIRERFLAHGVNVPFWITEVGWSTWEMSEADQARNYRDLVAQVAARPWVRSLFAYCLRELKPPPGSKESGFGLLTFGTWQPKPAYTALQEGFPTLH